MWKSARRTACWSSVSPSSSTSARSQKSSRYSRWAATRPSQPVWRASASAATTRSRTAGSDLWLDQPYARNLTRRTLLPGLDVRRNGHATDFGRALGRSSRSRRGPRRRGPCPPPRGDRCVSSSERARLWTSWWENSSDLERRLERSRGARIGRLRRRGLVRDQLGLHDDAQRAVHRLDLVEDGRNRPLDERDESGRPDANRCAGR